MKLKFIQYDHHFKRVVEEYRLSENNLRYTQLPRVAVTSLDPLCTHILVMDADTLVTFFTLDRGKSVNYFTNKENALLIKSFSTDVRHQGKGYAKLALQQLPAYIQSYFQEVEELVLAVNCHNQAALDLYTRCGFSDTKKRCLGRNGTVMIMKKELKIAAEII